MKIELNENKVFFNNGESVQEIHPFWLRERVDGDEFLDKGTQQRLFDPSTMNGEIIIKKAQIKNGFLEVNFNDGVNSKLDINKLETEFSNKDTVIKSIPKKKWDSTLKNIKNFEYKEGFFESKEMYDLLVSFYEFGFVVIKNVPTENNYIVKFARARGISEKSIHYKHALKNGLIPVITIAGINIGTLIAFSIITETVFQWPGMGFLFIQAVQFVDIPIMSAYLVFIAFVFVMINFIVDILYYFIDPRIRVKAEAVSG